MDISAPEPARIGRRERCKLLRASTCLPGRHKQLPRHLSKDSQHRNMDNVILLLSTRSHTQPSSVSLTDLQGNHAAEKDFILVADHDANLRVVHDLLSGHKPGQEAPGTSALIWGGRRTLEQASARMPGTSACPATNVVLRPFHTIRHTHGSVPGSSPGWIQGFPQKNSVSERIAKGRERGLIYLVYTEINNNKYIKSMTKDLQCPQRPQAPSRWGEDAEHLFPEDSRRLPD